MIHLFLSALLAAVVGQTPSAQTTVSPCVEAASIAADIAVVELCAGEDEARQATTMRGGDRERVSRLESAAAHYRRAVNLSAGGRVAVLALVQLADMYDSKHLDRADAEEQVLRELIARTPEDLAPAFRLSRVQEERGLIEAAEATLLDARHRQPDAEEPNSMLAQFYARRITALHARNQLPAPGTVSNPGEPDTNGIYRIGDSLKAPARDGVPQYPPEARAAGIRGTVQTEIVIDPQGNVAAARVVRSVPMLDDAALKAVRLWKFAPTLVNGQPVPVRMTVSVNFMP